MLKNLRAAFGLLLLVPLLSGCIGAAIFLDPEDCEKGFPNLGTVPPPPTAPDVALHNRTEAQMATTQQEAMAQNKLLRDQFNLETKSACEPK